MTCGSCGTDLSPDATFCSECGTPTTRPCHGCGRALAPYDKFCSECGTAAGGAPAEEAWQRAGLTTLIELHRGVLAGASDDISPAASA